MKKALGVPVVVKASDYKTATGQVDPGVSRAPLIDRSTPGVTKLVVFMGRAEPHSRSLMHHHGEAETYAYMVRGTMRVYFGEDFKEFLDVGPGDCAFVPAYCPHIEANEQDEPAEAFSVRVPDNIVVNI